MNARVKEFRKSNSHGTFVAEKPAIIYKFASCKEKKE